jgi:hypothetical protein
LSEKTLLTEVVQARGGKENVLWTECAMLINEQVHDGQMIRTGEFFFPIDAIQKENAPPPFKNGWNSRKGETHGHKICAVPGNIESRLSDFN